MPESRDPPPSLLSAEEVIDRLHDLALNPDGYEELLDHWEAMLRPHRGPDGDGLDGANPDAGLLRLQGHFTRAARVLDAGTSEQNAPQPPGSGEEILAGIERSAAFLIDRDLHVIAVNAAAAAAFGAIRGGRLADLGLGGGDGGALSDHVARLFASNSGDPVVVRARAPGTDRLVILYLRLVRAPAALPDRAPVVIAVTSEMTWPPGLGDLLRQAFDLTPAEADVLCALAEGRAIARIATSRERSPATIRAQLKAIMAKTETRSQAELIRLTLSTVEMARFSDEAAREPVAAPRPHCVLLPQPFHSLTLPDGRRQDYLILGDPGGRPLLFLPLDYGLTRWPASAEAEARRRGIRIIVPIRPGFGQSTPLPGDTPCLPQIVADMACLLDHLGIKDLPVLTLGSDSFLAFAFHSAFAGRMRALIACAGVLPLTRPEQYERMGKWHRFIQSGARYTPHLMPVMARAGFALARRLGKGAFFHAIYGESPADAATLALPEVQEAMICGTDVALSDSHSAHDAFAREILDVEATDWSSALAALRGTVPVHFINGLQDPQVPPATLAEHRRDYPWIDFRIHADAGQLLFFLKWPELLPLIESCLDGPELQAPTPNGV